MPSDLSLTRAVTHDALRTGIPVPLAWAVAALPVLGGLLVAATYPSWSLFTWILREDHLVEWAQFCFCLSTALIALLAARGFTRDRQWPLAAAIAAIGLGTLALAGEEISWGQRAIGLTTPAALEALNAQGELTVHNVTGIAGLNINTLFNLTELSLSIAGVCLPLLVRLHPHRHPRLLPLTPLLFLVPAFAFAAAYRALRFAMKGAGISSDAAVAYNEWAELMLHVGLLGLAVTAYAATRHRTPPPGPPAGFGTQLTGGHEAFDHLPPAPRTATGPAPVPILRDRALLAAVTLSATLTVVLAALTRASGVLPGNVG